MEQQLVDQLAQWQTLLWAWQEAATAWASVAGGGSKRREEQGHEPPRLSHAEALEQAVRMVERIQSLYLRTLRALQDQRRQQPAFVRPARQVKLARQQVIVSASEMGSLRLGGAD
jgi:hypothetical protein